MDTRPLDPLDQALRDLGIPPKPPLPAVPAAPPQTAVTESVAQRSRPTSATPGPRRYADLIPSRTTKRVARVLLALYVVSLTLIAIWPVPVDREAGPVLRAVTRLVPMLTYARIEFAANILLFVPLGVLLALILSRRYLVVPIAFVTTVVIESIQGVALSLRTPSIMDIVANITGACIGLLLVAAVESWRQPDEQADDLSGTAAG